MNEPIDHLAGGKSGSAVAPQINSAVPVDETAWLLEWHFHGSIHYFGMSDLFPDFDFSHLDKAMRFARAADAEQAKRWVERTDRKRLRGELRDLRIAEHMWPTATQAQA